MKERLLEFLAHLGMGQNKFEEKTGLARGLINKIKGNISVKSLNKIAAAYPELNITWLQTGEGEMLKTAATPKQEVADVIQMPREVFNQINDLVATVKSQQASIESLTRSVETLSKKGEDVGAYGHAAPQAAQG